MKKKLIIEIETKDYYDDVFPESDKLEESDYKEGEVEAFRKEFTKDIQTAIVEYIKKACVDDIEEYFLDSLEELSIEGWDTLEDYGIKIKVIEDINNG